MPLFLFDNTCMTSWLLVCAVFWGCVCLSLSLVLMSTFLFSKTNIASVVTICYSAKHVCLVMYLELMFNISLQVLSVASLFLWYAVLQTVVDSSISVAFWVVTWTSRICCSDLLHSYEAFAWPYSVCCCRHFSSAAVAWYIYCCDMLPY